LQIANAYKSSKLDQAYQLAAAAGKTDIMDATVQKEAGNKQVDNLFAYVKGVVSANPDAYGLAAADWGEIESQIHGAPNYEKGLLVAFSKNPELQTAFQTVLVKSPVELPYIFNNGTNGYEEYQNDMNEADFNKLVLDTQLDAKEKMLADKEFAEHIAEMKEAGLALNEKDIAELKIQFYAAVVEQM
jgi:hypothetical protein